LSCKKIAASEDTPATPKLIQSVTERASQLQDCSYNYNTSTAMSRSPEPKKTSELWWKTQQIMANPIGPNGCPIASASFGVKMKKINPQGADN